jgi:hypothetical protein
MERMEPQRRVSHMRMKKIPRHVATRAGAHENQSCFPARHIAV